MLHTSLKYSYIGLIEWQLSSKPDALSSNPTTTKKVAYEILLDWLNHSAQSIVTKVVGGYG
jgi:hypothetical protein